MDQKVKIDDISELNEFLASSGVQVASWAGSKTVEALFSEIKGGECQLHYPPLERRLRIVRLALFSKRDGSVLIEESIEHADGRIQKRGRLLSEKMLPGESPENCARRAVAEELPIADLEKFRINKIWGPSMEHRESTPSYPGLRSRYEIYDVSGTIEGLPTENFFTKEVDLGNLLAVHSWRWSEAIPEEQKKARGGRRLSGD